jgi:hypothetical protein
MDLTTVSPDHDISIMFIGIGCILMSILGGFTSEFILITSVKQFFNIFIRSTFIGLITFLVCLSLKIPWWIKIALAGFFGFYGIQSILFLFKKVLSTLTSGMNDLPNNISGVNNDKLKKQHKPRETNRMPKTDGHEYK